MTIPEWGRRPMQCSLAGVIAVAGAVTVGCASSARPKAATRQTDTIQVADVPLDRVRQLDPVWARSLDEVELPDGSRWAASGISAISGVGNHLVAVDATNNQLLVLRQLNGVVEQILGGFGQGPHDLSQPTDAAALGDILAVSDRGNQRLLLVNRLLEPAGIVSLGRVVHLVAGNRDGLVVLHWNDSETVAGWFRCCPLTQLSLKKLGRVLPTFPHDLALTQSGNQVLAVAPSLLVVMAPSTRVLRVLRFRSSAGADDRVDSVAGAPAALLIHAVAGAGHGEDVLISFGAHAVCLDSATGAIRAAWRPASRAGELISAISLLWSDGKEVYTFQPAGQRVSRFTEPCGYGRLGSSD